MSARDGLRATPVTIARSDGKTAPARIVTPAWSRTDLEDLVRGEAERGLITREHADRLIADGRERLDEDGTARERQQEPRTPRRRTR